jgi:hypothetical protein
LRRADRFARRDIRDWDRRRGDTRDRSSHGAAPGHAAAALRRLRCSELGQLRAYFADFGAERRDLLLELGALPLGFGRRRLGLFLGVVGESPGFFSGVLNQRIDFARAIVE